MANLYDKAGLVNIPVGYQDGFLYNIKPTDNTLGFRFNRDSAATRVNEQGLIEQVGYFGPELVTNGNFATDSDWTKGTGWSIANGRASYDGTGGTSFIRQNDVIEVGKTYKVTLEVLANEGSGINTIFLGGTVLNSSHLSVGSYTFYGSTNNTAVTLTIYGRSGEVFEIDNVSVKEVLGDKPRIDYTDSLTSPSFLLEPQRQNIITYSQDASQWGYSGITTPVSQDGSINNPDGILGANKIIPTSGSALKYFFPNNTYSHTSGDTYSFSVFAKANELKYIQITGNSNAFGNGQYANFDLEKGVIGTYTGATSGTTPKIEDYGNGWYRCHFQVNAAATTTQNIFVVAIVPSSSASRLQALNPNGSDSLYVYGFQAELGSYATSYIPTAGSTVTRAQETCNGAGNASTFNSTEGVLYAEIAALADDLTFRSISLNDGTNTNSVGIRYRTNSNRVNAIIKDGNGVNLQMNVDISDITQFNKIALKYKSGDVSMYINGTEVATNSLSFSFTAALNDLSFDRGDSNDKFVGKTKALAVFKEALSDTELQKLTQV